MISTGSIPKIGETTPLSSMNTEDVLKLDTGTEWGKSVFGLANMQQGLVGQGIPADSIENKPINGSLIINGTVGAKKLVIGNSSFVSNIIFTTEFYDQVSWTAGTLQFKDGSTASVVAGTTGRLGDTTTRYIYYKSSIGSTLQVTTDFTNIQGDAVLLCIVKPQPSSSSGAVMSVIDAEGTTISGDSITTGIIQSSDGSTYFDLNNNKIVINDGTNDRVLIGQF